MVIVRALFGQYNHMQVDLAIITINPLPGHSGMEMLMYPWKWLSETLSQMSNDLCVLVVSKVIIIQDA